MTERRAVRSPARDVKYLPDSGAVCLNEEEDYIARWSGPGPRTAPVSTTQQINRTLNMIHDLYKQPGIHSFPVTSFHSAEIGGGSKT